MPRSRLEREYVLNALLATFIRAIRVGVVNPAHSAVVLAHYDRLGSGFDTNIKVIIDFLRDLGMFRGQGQTVVEVVTRALEEVRHTNTWSIFIILTIGQAFCLFLDDAVHTDEHAVALARALNSCFVIRGAQLAIIKRLESECVVEVHTRSISWVIERLSAYNIATNNMAKKTLLFFRVFQQLLSPVDSRDALKM